MPPAPLDPLYESCSIITQDGNTASINLGGPWTKARLRKIVNIMEYQPEDAAYRICQAVLAALIKQLSYNEGIIALFYELCESKYRVSDAGQSPTYTQNWKKAHQVRSRYQRSQDRIRAVRARAQEAWVSPADGVTRELIDRLFLSIPTVNMADAVSRILHRPKRPSYHEFRLAVNNEIYSRLTHPGPGRRLARSVIQGDLNWAHQRFRTTQITDQMIQRIGMDYGSDGLLSDAATIAKTGQTSYTAPKVSPSPSPPPSTPGSDSEMEIDSDSHSDTESNSHSGLCPTDLDLDSDAETDSIPQSPTDDPPASDSDPGTDTDSDIGTDTHTDTDTNIDSPLSPPTPPTPPHSPDADPDYKEPLPHQSSPRPARKSNPCLCIQSGFSPSHIRLLNRSKPRRTTAGAAATEEEDESDESYHSHGDEGDEGSEDEEQGYFKGRVSSSLFDRIAGKGTATWSLSQDTFCRRHTRLLAGGLGLRSISHTDLLLSRLQFIFEHLEDLPQMRGDPECEQFSWFQRAARAPAPSDAHGVFKYPVEFPKPRVDRFAELGLTVADIYDRVIHRPCADGEGAAIAGAWEADGSVVIPIFEWLGDKQLLGCQHGDDVPCGHDGGLWPLINLEFEMYEHHRSQGEDRDVQGVTSMGWLRSMWHGLIQQLIRQDPAYYAFYVCLRPDHAWRLISSPYYSKSTSAGARTAFRHIDINVPRYLARGRSAHIIQGTVTLTDEDEANCTELLLGMHQDGRLQEWWNRIIDRGLETDGMVHNVTRKMWSQEDEDHFGIPWTRQICRRGEARISRPQLPHRSTGPATMVRRTVLPWFIGIKEDHKQLDTNDTGS
ncbi:unnamed protein product [Penicillium palitans]